MNRINNNKGYALIIVLLITAVFTIFTLSFIGISANTTKQNEIIERNSQSVALAEMGVTYFENAIKNSFNTHYDTVIDYVKNEREEDLLNNELKSEEEYKQDAIKKMREEIEEDIDLLAYSIQINDRLTSNFTITPVGSDESAPVIVSDFFIPADNGFKISYESFGFEESKKTNIIANMEFDFSELFQTGPPSDKKTSPILQNNSILEPGNLESCTKNGKKSEFINIDCQIIGDASYDQNDKLSFDNATYKLTGSLIIPKVNINSDIKNDSLLYIKGNFDTCDYDKNNINCGNANGIYSSKIHVDGYLNIGHINGNGLDNSIIEITKYANIIGNMKLTKSTLFIGGTANIGKINGMENSIIYINSNATIDGIDINNNSKICVNGNLQINQNFNNNSSNSNVYAKSSNNSKVITNSEKFTNACTIEVPSNEIKIGNIKLTTDFEYVY